MDFDIKDFFSTPYISESPYISEKSPYIRSFILLHWVYTIYIHTDAFTSHSSSKRPFFTSVDIIVIVCIIIISNNSYHAKNIQNSTKDEQMVSYSKF